MLAPYCHTNLVERFLGVSFHLNLAVDLKGLLCILLRVTGVTRYVR